MTGRLRIAVLVAIGSLALPAARARAAEESDVDAQTRAERSNALVVEGERLYTAGKYRESAEALLQAYDLDPHPTLLYNLGRAYDQAGEVTRAVAFYGKYVEDPNAEAQLVRKANLALDRLRLLASKEEQTRQRELEQRKRYEAEARAARTEQARMKAREDAQVEREQRSKSLSTTGSYLAGGAAVAGAAVGLVFAVNAGASKRAFLEAPDVASKRRFESQTRSQALIADVSLAVAIAGAVGAVLLYPRGDDAGLSLAISPLGGFAEVKF